MAMCSVSVDLETTELQVSFSLEARKVRDDDLVFLGAFPDLERLMLGRTAITDAGLKHATELHELTTLGLIGTKVNRRRHERASGAEQARACSAGKYGRYRRWRA